MRKLIEQHRRKYQQQRNFYDEQNYKSRFGIKDDEIRSFNVKGIATDRKENKLVMAEDKQDNQKLLLYANKNNDMYYLNSGNSYKEAVQNTFGKSSNYEMVDDNLFIYNSQKQALTNYSQLDNYHNKQEELQYDRKLQEERKRVLTDPQTIHNQAKEDLALSLGLTATALKGEINVTSIEDVTDSEEMITIENEITGKDEHFISNFKDSFSEKIKEGLNVSPSVKLGFEEFKNASLQIAMGFTEFHGTIHTSAAPTATPANTIPTPLNISFFTIGSSIPGNFFNTIQTPAQIPTATIIPVRNSCTWFNPSLIFGPGSAPYTVDDKITVKNAT